MNNDDDSSSKIRLKVSMWLLIVTAVVITAATALITLMEGAAAR